MKTAIYIENGAVQLVLTPENDWEKSIISDIDEREQETGLSVYRGEFYNCQGGWTRQGSSEQSLIFRFKKGVVQ